MQLQLALMCSPLYVISAEACRHAGRLHCIVSMLDVIMTACLAGLFSCAMVTPLHPLLQHLCRMCGKRTNRYSPPV